MIIVGASDVQVTFIIMVAYIWNNHDIYIYIYIYIYREDFALQYG